MLTRLLLLILLLALALRAIGRLLRGIVEGAASQPRSGGPRRPAHVPAKSELMARDPVCGTYVVPSRALSERGTGGTQYFCSEKCRQAYRSRS
jgi:YHS domain-containing protein